MGVWRNLKLSISFSSCLQAAWIATDFWATFTAVVLSSFQLELDYKSTSSKPRRCASIVTLLKLSLTDSPTWVVSRDASASKSETVKKRMYENIVWKVNILLHHLIHLFHRLSLLHLLMLADLAVLSARPDHPCIVYYYAYFDTPCTVYQSLYILSYTFYRVLLRIFWNTFYPVLLCILWYTFYRVLLCILWYTLYPVSLFIL